MSSESRKRKEPPSTDLDNTSSRSKTGAEVLATNHIKRALGYIDKICAMLDETRAELGESKAGRARDLELFQEAEARLQLAAKVNAERATEHTAERTAGLIAENAELKLEIGELRSERIRLSKEWIQRYDDLKLVSKQRDEVQVQLLEVQDELEREREKNAASLEAKLALRKFLKQWGDGDVGDGGENDRDDGQMDTSHTLTPEPSEVVEDGIKIEEL